MLLVNAILGGFGWYVLCGIVFALISLVEILSDLDALRTVLGRDVAVGDLVLILSMSVLFWPVQVWEWSNGNGPWRG